MDRQHYCVYNQTSECFLSLGVTLCESAFARLKGMWERIGQPVDEGAWITRPRGVRTVELFSARDIVYLDRAHKVLDVIESHPAFRLVPYRQDAASILALPIRTIRSSQTLPGSQLVICLAEEMEFRLRKKPSHVPAESIASSGSARAAGKNLLPHGVSHDRLSAVRKSWPRLVAYDSAGSSLPVHGIRDVSSTGLYLMTKERWPLGSHVRMSLQRTDGNDGDSNAPITAELRVARWGSDGVGLEFLQSSKEHAAWASRDMS